jgi:AbiEi antitoxin C-terminal domain/Protein of unknown function (DUF559)
LETPFLGREALDRGLVTRHQLRGRFVTVYPGVYVAADDRLTARDRACAAWLWLRRRGVLAGGSAAAVQRTKWLNPAAPAELIHTNRHPPMGNQTWADVIAADEITEVDGMRVTTPARTALDLARRYPLDQAVTTIDALLHATKRKVADVELLVDRHRGIKGIRRARRTIELADPEAESPRETWLRLLVVRAGVPCPTTQLLVHDRFGQVVARVDLGWSDLKIAIEYDGDHHWTDRRQLTYDIRRTETLRELGWIVIRVTADDTPATILHRVDTAMRARRHSV